MFNFPGEGERVWDKATGTLQHPPSSAQLCQCDFIQKRKSLTRTRLLTAARTAATGADRSGIPFPSTSPSSCIITRWDICWATGSRILSIVFVWKTGMMTTLDCYPSKTPTTEGSFLLNSHWRNLNNPRSLFFFTPPRQCSRSYEDYKYSCENMNAKNSQRASPSNLHGFRLLANQLTRRHGSWHPIGRQGCRSG